MTTELLDPWAQEYLRKKKKAAELGTTPLYPTPGPMPLAVPPLPPVSPPAAAPVLQNPNAPVLGRLGAGIERPTPPNIPTPIAVAEAKLRPGIKAGETVQKLAARTRTALDDFQARRAAVIKKLAAGVPGGSTGLSMDEQALFAAQTPEQYEQFKKAPTVGEALMKPVIPTGARQWLSEQARGLPGPLGKVAGPAVETATGFLNPAVLATLPLGGEGGVTGLAGAAAGATAGQIATENLPIPEGVKPFVPFAGMLVGGGLGAKRPGVLAPEEAAQAMGREVAPKDMVQSILQGVKAKAPVGVTPPEVGGVDLVGDFLKRAGTPKEPVFGAIHDMAVTPSPKWMEDPYIKFMEGFTRPNELNLPAPLTPLGDVERRMATMGDYYEQVASRTQRVREAKARLQDVRDAYASEKPRRALVRGAQEYGVQAPTEPLISRNEIVRAQKDVRVAGRQTRQAISALNEADVRRAGDDIVEEARAMGADETVVSTVRVGFENAARIEKLDEPFMNLPPWRKRLVAAGAHIPPISPGYVPGKVGQLWENAGNLRVALGETRRATYEHLDALQQRMEEELPALKFIGQGKYAPLADKYGAFYLYLHPEDFKGISPELRQTMDEMDQAMYSRYAMLQAIDPKAAPPLPIGQRYLPRLWQDNIDFLESIRRPSGRPGVEKPRTIANWREAVLSQSWPKELSDMSPAELLEYSTRAVDDAISHRVFRKSVLDVYGSKLKPKAAAGLVRLQNPLFAGWWAPPDVRWQVDALFEPGPQWTRTMGKYVGQTRNLTFGIDTGLAGYNELQALATGHLNIVAGGLNRMLNLIGAGVDVWSKRDVSRSILFQLHGLAQPVVEAPFRKGLGTLIKYIPGIGKLDPALSAAIDKWTGVQYGMVLGNTRSLMAEGNLLIAKLLGRDLEDPQVIGAAMDTANAFTGTSRGAMRMGTAEVQNVLLTSSRITRSQFAMVGQLANMIRPAATGTQRIMAAVGITNFMLTLGLAGYALNRIWGDGADYNPLPWTLENGKLKRNQNWATVAINGRRYSLIPQKSLMTTMWKAGEALMALDPNALGRAASQYGYTRLGPGLQPIPLIFGFGYLPNSGFWAGNMPTQQRFKALGLPFVPILAQVALTGQEHGFRGFAEQFFGLNSYDLTPADKEKMFLDKIGPTLGKDDQAAIAAGVVPNSVRQMPEYQGYENERLQDQLNNPRTKAYAELKQTRDEAIAAAGQTYLQDKDGYSYRMAVSSARDRFVAETTGMQFQDDTVIAKYLSATYDKAVDPLTGEVDPEQLDDLIEQWEKKATSQDFAAVRTWERASSDPLEAEYRTDRQKIEDSGWWDLKDKTWQRVGAASAPGFASYADYQTYLRKTYLPKIPENLDPGMRIALLEVVVRADPTVKAMDTVSSAVNRAWLDAHPDILSLILKWGYKIPGKADIEALTGASE